MIDRPAHLNGDAWCAQVQSLGPDCKGSVKVKGFAGQKILHGMGTEQMLTRMPWRCALTFKPEPSACIFWRVCDNLAIRPHLS